MPDSSSVVTLKGWNWQLLTLNLITMCFVHVTDCQAGELFQRTSSCGFVRQDGLSAPNHWNIRGTKLNKKISKYVLDVLFKDPFHICPPIKHKSVQISWQFEEQGETCPMSLLCLSAGGGGAEITAALGASLSGVSHHNFEILSS
ncbi:hypothetical protein EK904_002921 [Melospiza melodia maxima]|nr:hypothetical protein EK904_002921 [Melospiza melodia maxima]